MLLYCRLASAARGTVAQRGVRALASLPFDPAPALDSHGRVPTAPYTSDPLCGTAPEYKTHLFVWPAETSRPPSTWPASIASVSPLMAELLARRSGSLAGYGVTFAQGTGLLRSPWTPWDPNTLPAMRMPPGHASEDEQFWLYAYRAGLMARYPTPVSARTLPDGQTLAAEFDRLLDEPAAYKTDETHIYVCVHGTVDCRCGVVGNDLIAALKAQARKHEADCAAQGTRPSRRVHVIPVSHVGGHKWAANALVYPHGDWYGNLRVSDAPLLLRAALAPASSRHDLRDMRERLVVWPRWRGRLGLDKLTQNEHYSIWGPPVVYPAHVVPRARAGAPTSKPAAKPEAKPTAQPAGIQMRFRTPQGEWIDIGARPGESLMEVARANELPGIDGTCDGNLECATCHAYICGPGEDPNGPGDLDAPAPEDAGAGEVSEAEDDMLEYAIARHGASRLTCQVRVNDALSRWMMTKGGRIELPQY